MKSHIGVKHLRKPRLLRSGVECPYCGWLSNDTEKVYKHYYSCTEIPSDYNQVCKVCRMKSTTKEQHTQHMKTHPTCIVCRQVSMDVNEFVKHITDKHPMCTICGELTEASTPNKRRDHLQSHASYRCFWCKSVFPTHRHLGTHFLTHPERKCPVCCHKLRNQSELIAHIKVVHCGMMEQTSEAPMFDLDQGVTCSKCKLILPTESELKVHLREVHMDVVASKATVNKANCVSKAVSKPRGIVNGAQCPYCRWVTGPGGTVDQVYDHYKWCKVLVADKVKCTVCSSCFDNIDNLAEHKKTHFICNLCKEPTGDLVSLMKHVYVKHPLCACCGTYLKDPDTSTFASHSLQHDAILCFFCGEKFSCHERLRDHFKMHDERICHMCSGYIRVFSKTSEFAQHLLKMHFNPKTQKTNVDNVPQKLINRELQKVKMNKTLPNSKVTFAKPINLGMRYQCPYCKWTTDSTEFDVYKHYEICSRIAEQKLQKPKAAKTSPVTYSCSFCNEKFTSKVAYTKHMNKYPKCNICGVAKKNVTSLLKHVDEIHRCCCICATYLKDNSDLQRHLKEHKESDKFVADCLWCGRVFRNYDKLHEHAKNHPMKKCHACQELFPNEKAMIVHIEESHFKVDQEDASEVIDLDDNSSQASASSSIAASVSSSMTASASSSVAASSAPSNVVAPPVSSISATSSLLSTQSQNRAIRKPSLSSASASSASSNVADSPVSPIVIKPRVSSNRPHGRAIKRPRLHSDMPVKCKICGYLCVDGDEYMEHRMLHPVCPVCHLMCTDGFQLHNHMEQKHTQCLICGEAIESKVVDHYDKHVDITCFRCGQQFAIVEQLRAHAVYHKEKNCRVCGIVFTHSDMLDVHVQACHGTPQTDNKHDETTPVDMKKFFHLCNRQFSSHNNFLQHCKQHSTCKVCNQVFSNDNTLQVHGLKAHGSNATYVSCVKSTIKATKGRPRHIRQNNLEHVSSEWVESSLVKQKAAHSCLFCSAKFHNINDLLSHRKTAHMQCILCGRILASEDFVLRHYTNHHQHNNVLRCYICSEQFANIAEVVCHDEQIHQGCRLCGADLCQTYPLKMHLDERHKDIDYELAIRDVEPIFCCPECGHVSVGLFDLALHITDGHFPKSSAAPRSRNRFEYWSPSSYDMTVPMHDNNFTCTWSCDLYDHRAVNSICRPFSIQLEGLPDSACCICDKYFVTEDALNEHTSMEHATVIVPTSTIDTPSLDIDNMDFTNLIPVKSEPLDDFTVVGTGVVPTIDSVWHVGSREQISFGWEED